MFAYLNSSMVFFVLLVSLSILFISMEAEATKPITKITVMGTVYCDMCSSNTFSRHSFYLSGVDVHIDCKFKASIPTTSELISFSVNRTTDKYGVYKLDIPSVGVNCAEGHATELSCRAITIGSSSSLCNIPGLSVASEQVKIKSRHNHCIYCLNALNYKPPKRNITLCGNQ
ncbi:hypothetical protein AQUCO_02100068v1 [Aquilegia coerulea]|uniref:Pollen Ole e 1 allergen and extensin family protein n=1 Tax=Aquilegia coerulea TaxID=218851 RepID=A0A2G5DEN5_AQUCA|nr:hypothetical protein AQUCO_02100068v1 [Aquilegia coerulea]